MTLKQRLPLWVLAGAVLIYLVGRMDACTATSSAAELGADVLLHGARAYQGRLDSLGRLEARLSNRVALGQLALSASQRRIDSLGAIVGRMPAESLPAPLQALLAAQGAAIGQCRETLGLLERADTACQERGRLASFRADSLTRALGQLLTSRKCAIAWVLPCPPRGALFLLGAGLGFYLGRQR